MVFGSRGWDAGRGDDCYPVEQAAASAPAQRQAIRHKVKNPAAPVKRVIKKQLRLDVSLHALLQILSLTLFEKLPLKQAVASVEPFPNNQTFHSQLNLFEF